MQVLRQLSLEFTLTFDIIVKLQAKELIVQVDTKAPNIASMADMKDAARCNMASAGSCKSQVQHQLHMSLSELIRMCAFTDCFVGCCAGIW